MGRNRFDGHSVLITGSTSGIGFASASRLHDEGATVVFHGQRPREGVSEELDSILNNSTRAHYLQADLADPHQSLALAREAAELAGGLNGLVLNAAVPLHKNWLDVTADEWDRVMSINVRSHLLVSQGATPFLRDSEGSIVFVSSTNAFRVNKSNFVYDSSKAALNHMARAIALELREDRIRVNVVMPGGVDTPMLKKWLEDYAGSEEGARNAMATSKERGIVGSPGEIAGCILFLLSQDARWVTGASLVVDGGSHLDR